MTFKQPDWRLPLSHRIGRTPQETALVELDEMEREVRRLQHSCARMRQLLQRNAAAPVGRTAELNQHFVALDGWCISIAESYFELMGLLLGRAVQQTTLNRWRRDLQRWVSVADELTSDQILDRKGKI